VRPEGANHLWRKIPPRELSIDVVVTERLRPIDEALPHAGASQGESPEVAHLVHSLRCSIAAGVRGRPDLSRTSRNERE
jgi:hypothetical protein